MDIKAALNEKIKQFEDYKKQIMDLNRQIGSLQEQGQAIHMAAMAIKGGIDTLQGLLNEQDEEAKKAKAALILPDKTLVASDGKTPIAKVEDAPAAPVAEAPKAETPAETPKAPVVLEVK